MRADARVDVISDNTSHPAVLPWTMTPEPYTQEQRKARLIVRDNIDTIDRRPDDRVMQIYQREGEGADHSRDDGSCARSTSVASTTVLVIAGISIGAVGGRLVDAAAPCSPNGITLNVFDSLALLPDYSETLENQPLPPPAAALRNAAIEAHATMVLTHYYGHIPAMVHNAIDWLTRRWNQSALHDKPLAVIGPTKDGYSGVWSRHQTEESRRIAGTRIVEPITVTTLLEAVTKLTEQANITNQPSSPISVTNRHRSSK